MEWSESGRLTLDPVQREVVRGMVENFDQPVWIRGIAGTGKSIVLLEVARRTAERFPDARVGVVTFTSALAGLLEYHKKIERIEIFTHDEFQSVHGVFDFVLLDEVQDLSREFLEGVQAKSTTAWHCAGDFKQQINNWFHRRNATNAVSPAILEDYFGFNPKTLTKAHRLSESGVHISCAILGDSWPNDVETSGDPAKYYYTNCSTESEMLRAAIQLADDDATSGEPSAVIVETNQHIANLLTIAHPSGTGLSAEKYWEESTVINERLRSLGSNIRILGVDRACIKEASRRPIVFVSTYHSAKGLDFPNAAVCFTGRGFIFPETLHVAMTRASRRTTLFFTKRPPFLEKPDVQPWIKELVDDDGF